MVVLGLKYKKKTDIDTITGDMIVRKVDLLAINETLFVFFDDDDGLYFDY